ncbi:MAG: hypothetical protein QOE70_2738 [Chthoniobacter sp.]|nr:hypothetical protein [Chthoniobacter sp.]
MFAVLVVTGVIALAVEPEPANPGPAVAKMDGLVAFWDFQEPAGEPRVSRGPQPFSLTEMKGPIARADEGVFGAHSARIKRGQWFMIERAQIGALDLHGKDAQVTVAAWVRREDKTS